MSTLSRTRDAGRLLLDLVTRDPAFVRGGGLEPRDIPVFTFHSLEPRSFERKMAYLIDAGYRAVGLEEYLDVLRGRLVPQAKSVLITIDDGRASTWTVGYPILKRLGMRATAFLVTSAVHDSADVSATIGEAGHADWARLVARDQSEDRPFVTWGEVRAMRGVIDLGSHTHLHARIPVSAEVEGFMTQAMQTGYGEFDCPFVWLNGRLVRGRDVPLGTPLPQSVPRLSGKPAYRAPDQRFENETEIRDAVRFDLVEARRLIQKRAEVDGVALCFPWHVDSPLAREIATEVGYLGGFMGKAASGPPISRPGSDLLSLARVGEDYVERLPGPNRRPLMSVLLHKLRRRQGD